MSSLCWMLKYYAAIMRWKGYDCERFSLLYDFLLISWEFFYAGSRSVVLWNTHAFKHIWHSSISVFSRCFFQIRLCPVARIKNELRTNHFIVIITARAKHNDWILLTTFVNPNAIFGFHKKHRSVLCLQPNTFFYDTTNVF